MPRQVKVTIVGGRLGAGKTTLLNRVLEYAAKHCRVAVLVNEFGSIDVDGELLAMAGRVPGDDIVKLDDGCICCEVNASLVAAVERVLAAAPDVEYIVVETSGVARLTPVVDTFLQTDLAASTRLDAVMYVVDGEQFARGDNRAQVVAGVGPADEAEHADVVILNKLDLVDDGAAVDSMVASLERDCRQAVVVRTEHGNAPLHALLDVGDTAATRADEPPAKRVRLGDRDAHAPERRPHADPFHAFTYRRARRVDPDKFEGLVESGLPRGIYRAKGFLWYPDVPQPVVFQLTGRRTNGFETDPREDVRAVGTRLVFIGRDFDDAELEAKLDACMLPEDGKAHA